MPEYDNDPSSKIDFLNESFNNRYWNQVIYHCIKNDDFLKKVVQIIPLETFRSREKRYIMKMLYEFYYDFKMSPKDNFYDLFKEHEKSMSDDLYEQCMALIKTLKSITGSNSEYILSRLSDALKHFYLEEASVEFASLIKRKKYDEAKSVILAAMKKTEIEEQEEYYDFFADKSYITKRLSEAKYKMKTKIVELDKIVGGFNSTWLINILASTKLGKCAHKDTEILLSDGSIKTIEQIYKDRDKNVVCLNEKTKKLTVSNVVDYFDNGIKECFEVETRTGRKVKITKNHPLLTLDGWKPLKDIGVGDSIAVPKEIPIFGTNTYNKNKLKLLAYLLADGGMTKQGSLSFTKNEPNIISDFEQCVNSFGDILSKTNKKGSFYITNNNKRSNTICWLDSLGLLGKKSEDKFIPDFIFKLKKEHIRLFLSVIFTCDGSINKSSNGNIEIDYCTTSEKMAYQIHHLLSRFGIISRLRKRKYKAITGYYFYSIDILNKENLIKFITNIGFQFSKNEKTKKYLKDILNKPNNRNFIGSFPYSFVAVLNKEIKKYNKLYGKNPNGWYTKKCVKNFIAAKNRKNGINKNTINDLAILLNSNTLKQYVNADIFWDSVVSIKAIGKHQTYDISIEKHHNFIADNIIIHNSWMLLEFAVSALLQNLNVLLVSLEMNKDMVDGRLDMIVGFMSSKETSEQQEILKYKKDKWVKTKEDVKTIYDITEVEKNRQRIRKIGGGSLKVMAFNRGRMNYMDIDRILNEAELNDGFVADVLIVDYLGLMKETSSGQSKKERISENCLGLKELCGKRNMIGITAMQGNRKAMMAKTFHSHMVADDIDVIFNSDLVLAMCQTKLEEKQNMYRLYCANYRHGVQHWTVRLVRDLTIGQIALDSLPYDEHDDDNEDNVKVKAF